MGLKGVVNKEVDATIIEKEVGFRRIFIFKNKGGSSRESVKQLIFVNPEIIIGKSTIFSSSFLEKTSCTNACWESPGYTD